MALGTEYTTFTVKSVFQNPLKPPNHENPQCPCGKTWTYSQHPPALSLEGGSGGGGSSSLGAGAGWAVLARSSPCQAGADSSSLSSLRRHFLCDPFFAVNEPLEGKRTTKAGGACCSGGAHVAGVYAWRWGRCH